MLKEERKSKRMGNKSNRKRSRVAMRRSLRTKAEVEVVDVEEEEEQEVVNMEDKEVVDMEDEEEETVVNNKKKEEEEVLEGGNVIDVEEPEKINEEDVEVVQYDFDFSDDEEGDEEEKEVIDTIVANDKNDESDLVNEDKEDDEDVVQVGETANSPYWNIQARILRIKKGIKKQTNEQNTEEKKQKQSTNMIDEVIIDDDDDTEEKEEEEEELEMQCLDEKLISVKTQRVPLKKQKAWRQPRYERICLLNCLFVLPLVSLCVCLPYSLYFQVSTRCPPLLLLEQVAEEPRHAKDEGHYAAGDGQDQGLGEGECGGEGVQEVKRKQARERLGKFWERGQ